MVCEKDFLALSLDLERYSSGPVDADVDGVRVMASLTKAVAMVGVLLARAEARATIEPVYELSSSRPYFNEPEPDDTTEPPLPQRLDDELVGLLENASGGMSSADLTVRLRDAIPIEVVENRLRSLFRRQAIDYGYDRAAKTETWRARRV